MKCNLIKMENNQGEKWVKIKYFKQQQIYGDYQASRVIWITTLKNELLIKFNILDKYGNMLYQISEHPESETFDLKYANTGTVGGNCRTFKGKRF